jgi:hypothetical protein
MGDNSGSHEPSLQAISALTGFDPGRGYFGAMRELVIERAAERLGASRADIPGLWSADGYPELTTNQMVSIAFPGYTGTPLS